MQFYYGQQMPLRILDEAEFWKLQEAEHTVVIREAFQNLEKKYVDALQEWEQALKKTQQTVVSYIETVIRSPHITPPLYRQIKKLISFCLEESMKFIKLCRHIRMYSQVAKENLIAQTILDHIIRESEYFIGIARVILSGHHSVR
jgi:hypothetical protein